MTVYMCKQCYKKISRLGLKAEILYFACLDYIARHDQAPTLDELEIDGVCTCPALVEFLEKKGLLVTTEWNNAIAVKPSWYQPESNFICKRDHL